MASVKPKICRAVHANRGVEAQYRKKLMQLIAEMQASVDHWIPAAYKKHPPRMAKLVETAQDEAGPSDRMRKEIEEMADRWIKKFTESAPTIAAAYSKSMFATTDRAFRKALKDAGWAVEFRMTPAMRDALNATIEENVALISSIPEQYFTQVQGVVMRSYTAGRDLHTMTKELKALYPKAQDRAELIARDQSNKANAVVNRARQLELGITEAIWMHSHAGKTPRPEHVAAHGRKYKIAEGCRIDGENIQPGEKINCRCTSRAVLPI